MSLRAALDEWDAARREALYASPGLLKTDLRTMLIRLGAYAEPHRVESDDEVDYTDWNGAVVGRGPSGEMVIARAGIPPDPTLPSEALEPLVDMGWFARGLVARHPAATALQLARVVDGQLVLHVLNHRAADEALFAVIARHGSTYIRGAVARHPRTSAAVLASLADDPDPDVRRAVAAKRR